MITKPPSDEQCEQYKALYKAYLLSSRALHAARQVWLPDQPAPEDALSDSQYMENLRRQEALIEEAQCEMETQ